MGCILLFRTCERSHSETLPAHLGCILGLITSGIWGSRLDGKDVHLCRVYFKPDISAVLMVMSGPDPHMIRIWTVGQQVEILQMEVVTLIYDDDIIMFFYDK